MNLALISCGEKNDIQNTSRIVYIYKSYRQRKMLNLTILHASYVQLMPNCVAFIRPSSNTLAIAYIISENEVAADAEKAKVMDEWSQA